MLLFYLHVICFGERFSHVNVNKDTPPRECEKEGMEDGSFQFILCNEVFVKLKSARIR